MQTATLKSTLAAAVEAAELGGNILLQFYGQLKHVRNKEFTGDLVTEADIASENALFEFFQKKFPDFGILGEESGAILPNAPWQWVVDPLDGTTNFTHKYPMFCVSIGLLYEGRPVLGVIYNPLHKELFQAAARLGATLNNEPIYVSKVDSLEKSLLVTGFAYDRRVKNDNNYKEFCRMTTLAQGVRRSGSAALDLAYTAAGFVDGYWERGLKPWDIAAGIAILQEAGGHISRYDGTPMESLHEDRILATNGLIHRALSKELISPGLLS